LEGYESSLTRLAFQLTASRILQALIQKVRVRTKVKLKVKVRIETDPNNLAETLF
jgi:hypothetical protein